MLGGDRLENVIVGADALVVAVGRRGGGGHDDLGGGEGLFQDGDHALKRGDVFLRQGEGTAQMIVVAQIPQAVVPVDHVWLLRQLGQPEPQRIERIAGPTAIFVGTVHFGAALKRFAYMGLISHTDGIAEQNDLLHIVR